jgi:hypothetical protein
MESDSTHCLRSNNDHKQSLIQHIVSIVTTTTHDVHMIPHFVLVKPMALYNSPLLANERSSDLMGDVLNSL